MANSGAPAPGINAGIPFEVALGNGALIDVAFDAESNDVFAAGAGVDGFQTAWLGVALAKTGNAGSPKTRWFTLAFCANQSGT